MTAIHGRRRATGRPALRITRLGALVAAACTVGTLAACGSSGTAGNEGKAPALPEKVDSIAAMVPKSIAERGTLVVAAGVYPPAVIEPVGGGTLTGWDIENARQIAAVMGLNAKFRITPFDAVITGLAANRYDAAVGEIYITPERTKSVTFVTNHESTDSLMVPANSDIKSANSKDELCGLTLAAQLGSGRGSAHRGHRQGVRRERTRQGHDQDLRGPGKRQPRSQRGPDRRGAEQHQPGGQRAASDRG